MRCHGPASRLWVSCQQSPSLLHLGRASQRLTYSTLHTSRTFSSSSSSSATPSTSTSSPSSTTSSSTSKPVQYSSATTATHKVAPHSFDSVHEHTTSKEPVMAFEMPVQATQNEDQIRAITGADPLKYNLPGSIDTVFKYHHRGFPVFPVYMREELKRRTIATVKSKVNLLRAQGEKITHDKVDAFVVEALHRDGVALAQNEDDAVHVLVTEAPRIGDEREADGKPCKVVRRYLLHDNGVTRLVLESELLPPAPADTIIKEFFTVADTSEPPPVMSEAEKNQKIAQISGATLDLASNPRRDVAFGQADVDRVLHEELLGKEMPRDQSPAEAAETRAQLEEAMFERDMKSNPR